MSKVFISATLRGFFGRSAAFETDKNTIQGILDHLKDEYPDSEKILFDEDGKLRSFIRIYAGKEDRTDLKSWDEEIGADTEVLILPAIAGGAPHESIISEERRKETLLSDKEVERYEKHLLLRDIGVKGQKRIKASRVVVI